MPAYALDVGSIVECTVRARLHGQRVINTFWYENTGANEPDGPAEVIALHALFNATIATGLVALQSEEIVERSLRVQPIQPIRFQYREQPATVTEGQVAAPSLPSTVAIVYRRKGTLTGPGTQGRIFIPGIPAGQTVGSLLTAAAAAAWRAAFGGDMTQAMTTGANAVWTPIIYQKSTGTVGATVATDQLDEVLRVQRRREIGKGE